MTEANDLLFKEWKHFYHQRELLSDYLTSELQNILKEESCCYDLNSPSYLTSEMNIFSTKKNSSSSRLVSLLQQSYAFQIQQSKIPSSSKFLNKELISVTDTNIPEIISLESIKYQEKEPLNTLVAVSEKKISKFEGNKPIIKRLIEDYRPTIFPTSVYAILSLSTPSDTSYPPHTSALPNSSTSTPPILSPSTSMIGQYLTQQIESKITSIAMFSSIQNGITVLGGLDTGEMIEWIISPNQTSSNKDVTDTSTTSTTTSSPPMSFFRTSYSLPGLSSDDVKIYYDNFNSINDIENFTNFKENYIKKHKKSINNKKIRDIVTNCSSSLSNQETQQYPLIAMSSSDGAINLFQTKDRHNNNNNSFYELQGRNKTNECYWYEHLGRINAHEGDVYTLAIDNSSSFLVSGGFDCVVSIMDLTTLSIIRRYQEHQASITHVGVNR